MRNIMGIILCAILMSFSGCGSIRINLNDHYKAADCLIKVIDMRPDPRLVSGFEGELFEFSPSVRDLLHSKICLSKEVVNSNLSENIVIKLRDIKYAGIVHMFSVETVLVLDGSVSYGNSYKEIQAGSNINKSGGTVKDRMPILLNEAADKFVKQVSENIK